MAKAFVTEQVSFNGQPMFTSQVGLNSSLVYNIEDGDVNARIFYKNPDGTVLNIIETPDTIGDILSGMNAVDNSDVTMFSVYDTNFNLILIPTSSFMMASEVNDGGSIITYVNGTTLATARVNNSVASLVNIINGVTAGQYDSGQITIDTTTGFTNQYVSAADNTFKNNAVGFYSYSGFASPLNLPNIIWNPNPTTNPSNPLYGYDSIVYLNPPLPWAAITKVTLYTNLTPDAPLASAFRIAGGYQIDYYNPGTTTIANPDYGTGGTGGLGTPTFFGPDQLLPGVPPTTPYTPNAGDPGTYWGETNYSVLPGTSTLLGYPIGIGSTFQGQATVNIPTPTLVDVWTTSIITFTWRTNNATPNLKFRFVIDYI